MVDRKPYRQAISPPNQKGGSVGHMAVKKVAGQFCIRARLSPLA